MFLSISHHRLYIYEGLNKKTLVSIIVWESIKEDKWLCLDIVMEDAKIGDGTAGGEWPCVPTLD